MMIDLEDAAAVISSLETTTINLTNVVREYAALVTQTREFYERMATSSPDPFARPHYATMAAEWAQMEAVIQSTLTGHVARIMAEQSAKEGH